ncbi:hypothetical protein PLICRDRAFT_291316 [Plicaturopsis crispa FD-325 SS-3]|nr:hypothetical protein PLICRDRAFT_291316 [Plicaturopsis crispa FD-325 SS-3]
MARLYRPTMLFSPSGPGEFAPLMGHDLVAVSPDFHPPYPYAVVSPDPRAHAPSPFHSPSSSVLDIRPPSSAMSIVERNSENLMVNFDRARSPHSIHSATAEGARHQQNSSLQDHDDLTTEEYELPAPPSSSDHHPRNEKRSEQDTSIEPFVLQSPPFNRDRPKKRRVLDPAPVISSSYNAPSPTAVASDAATIAPTLADGSSLAATSPTVRHSTAATRYSSQVSLSATLVTENPIPPGYTRRPPKWG